MFLSETLGAYDNKYLIRNKGILKTTINGNAKEHKEMHKNKCSDYAPNRGKGWLSECVSLGQAQCMQVCVCVWEEGAGKGNVHNKRRF